MFIGIDLGTSAVKVVLVDEQQTILASAEEKLSPTKPLPSWSEDDPAAWLTAVENAIASIRQQAPIELAATEAIGLSGQMHAPVLLDEAGKPVRPAILWNDGRAAQEAAELAIHSEALNRRLGVAAMASFCGPKILWLTRHEPAVLSQTRHMLMPKDYVRLHLTGEIASDVSDAAGAWLLDVEKRVWDSEAVALCNVDPAWLPTLFEATAPAGTLRTELASRWGMKPGVIVAAGGGDVAVGGLSIGAVKPGNAFISLGTSAQFFVASDGHRPDPARTVHAFCHVLPKTWFQMAALLNGASVLSAAAKWTAQDLPSVLAEVDARYAGPSNLMALPYLSGERTPHNRPDLRGAIIGLDSMTTPADIMLAMMESVAFSLADAHDVLAGQGPGITSAGLIGGGARSALWAKIIASVTGVTLVRYKASERGPAYGAARLARLAARNEAVADVAVVPPVESIIPPDPLLAESYAARIQAFRSLYSALAPEFAQKILC